MYLKGSLRATNLGRIGQRITSLALVNSFYFFVRFFSFNHCPYPLHNFLDQQPGFQGLPTPSFPMYCPTDPHQNWAQHPFIRQIPTPPGIAPQMLAFNQSYLLFSPVNVPPSAYGHRSSYRQTPSNLTPSSPGAGSGDQHIPPISNSSSGTLVSGASEKKSPPQSSPMTSIRIVGMVLLRMVAV